MCKHRPLIIKRQGLLGTWIKKIHEQSKDLWKISSVWFSHSVVSDSLRPHELQHARPPCPSPTPQSSLRLTCIESVMPSSHLILYRPLFLLPPIPPSIRAVFTNFTALFFYVYVGVIGIMHFIWVNFKTKYFTAKGF